MSSKMLIDASHPEETRVVVLKGHRIEEFDFESASKRQLRGNIYLAKVTRVEPSLQAAFVDYGGNRHGFLAFSEIHPDYYQIPHADRQALLEDEARAHRDEDDDTRAAGHRRSRRHKRDNAVSAMDRRDPADAVVSEPALASDGSEEDRPDGWRHASTDNEAKPEQAGETALDFTSNTAEPLGATEHQDRVPQGVASGISEPGSAPHDAEGGPAVEPLPDERASSAGDAAVSPADEGSADDAEAAEPVGEPGFAPPAPLDLRSSDNTAVAMIEGGPDSLLVPPETEPHSDPEFDEHGVEEAEDEVVEQIGGDELEETVRRAPRSRRHYKIQEVIKRRQILLIQVVKEERGNKGAALTTYLSLAGRYSVLMPNTARGGGISRKITDAEDRKRLKAIAQDLDVPEGMGIILRTAGAARSRVEVNRDFEYLLRMWESIRELTLKSTAPALVYEEGSLIKRSIRDLYTRDVEEVIVAGEEGHREARDFMQMLMPSAAKNVQLYRDSQPIFAKTGVEAQLDAMFSNHVTLKSGGYLVINQTEALVAIDVNSGRSTREHNIEDTALRTNLEAADEIARQLRLRDLAGLIVVDFIDMEEGRNNRAVERRIKEALKNDRARIQIGRISHFGLLEMSRQRMRTGVLEGSTVICPHCAGSGTVRSTASIALHVLRLVEDTLIKDASHNLIVRTRTEVALYILNQKRSTLNDLESRFGVSLSITVDPTLTGMVYHAIERGEIASPMRPVLPRGDMVRLDSFAYDEGSAASLTDEDEDESETEAADEVEGGGDASAQEREHASGDVNGDGRRRKRRRRRRGRERETQGEFAADVAASSGEDLEKTASAEEGRDPEPELGATELAGGGLGLADAAPQATVPDEVWADDRAVAEPLRRRRSRRSSARSQGDGPGLDPGALDGADRPTASEPGDDLKDEPGPAPRRRRAPRARSLAASSPDADALPDASQTHEPAAEPVASSAQPAPSLEPATAAADSDGAVAQPHDGQSPQDYGPVPAEAAVLAPPTDAEPEPDRPKRSGWWQRAKATFGS